MTVVREAPLIISCMVPAGVVQFICNEFTKKLNTEPFLKGFTRSGGKPMVVEKIVPGDA